MSDEPVVEHPTVEPADWDIPDRFVSDPVDPDEDTDE
jgi:hypothetical protein